MKIAVDAARSDKRMRVVQRLDHRAEDVEQLFRRGRGGYAGAKRFVCCGPVDATMFEETVLLGEGVPEHLEVGFRIVWRWLIANGRALGDTADQDARGRIGGVEPQRVRLGPRGYE